MTVTLYTDNQQSLNPCAAGHVIQLVPELVR